ncbi:DUF4350 domain-containing protein [Georgenia halophila]|uniref:DUF4350 domain-containing protein n=1 Tax=Georgenia halophila TaxID=620889 RepID=A0ABP8L0R6_9MICO
MTTTTSTSPSVASPEGAGPRSPDDAAPGTRRRRRRRRVVTAAVVVVFLALAILATLLQQRTSGRALAPDNPAPQGTMAVAEILRGQGVAVEEADSFAELTHVAGPRTTVFVTDVSDLRPGQYTELLGTGADLAIGGNLFVDPEVVADMPITLAGPSVEEVVQAQCAAPDAQAASRIAIGGGSVTATGSDVELCFPASEGAGGAYAVWEDEGSTVRYLADVGPVTNAALEDHGHAALALRMLGHHGNVVWYLPQAGSTGGAEDRGAPLMPPAGTWVLWALLAAAVVLAVGKARGLGPVVIEVMPVVVRAAETTRGRGRLYRRGGARDHAAAALRAGAAVRMSRALGLPRSADRPSLVDAVARATGWPHTDVDNLLYGTAPTDDGGLLALSTMLDALEKEVHRS